jgi:phosphomethylpyrimidine synthase
MNKNGSEKSTGTDSVDSVHSVEKQRSDGINKMDKIVSEFGSLNSDHSVPKSLPNSEKIYVGGELYKDVRVPFREISLAPTKTMSGEIEVNEPVRVYDTSGPWGDPDFQGEVTRGLPPLRAKWIRDRGDVEEYDGRNVQPIDDGWLSEVHAGHEGRKRPTSEAPNAQTGNLSTFNSQPSTSAQRRPSRARAASRSSNARQGISRRMIHAIRENGRS